MESQDIMQQFVDQTGVTFSVGWDPNNSYNLFRAASGGGISPFPLDVVIDQSGQIVLVSAEYEVGAVLDIVNGLIGE
jgi:hypothetical protein